MVAFNTNYDFTESGGGYLFCGLAALCFVGLLMMFLPHYPFLTKLYAGGAALLFSAYLVYDTQLIMGGNHANEFSVDDYVFAALNVYLDLVNLFLNLLELFGTLKDNN